MKLSEEIELIREDRLACGKLVEGIRLYATKRKASSYWLTNKHPIICYETEDDLPEYWGNIPDSPFRSTDFVAGNSKYPWMPTEISKLEIPF